MAKYDYTNKLINKLERETYEVVRKGEKLFWVQDGEIVETFPGRVLDACINIANGVIYLIADTTDDNQDNPECYEIKNIDTWNQIDRFSYDDASRHQVAFAEGFDIKDHLVPHEDYNPPAELEERYQQVTGIPVLKDPIPRITADGQYSITDVEVKTTPEVIDSIPTKTSV